MTLPRFYAPDLDSSRGDTELPAEESHHLVRVLRLTSGDQVVVFDGRGGAFLSRVSRADRRRASVTLLRPLPSAPEPSVRIALVQAALKGDKMDDVVRDATMAGVARIIPIVAERSLVKVSALVRAHAQERWSRVAVSSAKQCGRSRLPVLDAPHTFDEWLQAPAEGLRLLLVEPSSAEPSAARLRTVLDQTSPEALEAVSCIVGPEGGWSAAERDRATNAGCTAVSLGSMTLRANAAGLVAVSLVSFALEKPM